MDTASLYYANQIEQTTGFLNLLRVLTLLIAQKGVAVVASSPDRAPTYTLKLN
jgi:hypothetical protein